MQAIEKIDISTNWVTLIFMVLLLCVFLLKGFHRTKLKEYFFAFFNKGFIASEIEERASLLNRFSVVLFFFTTGTFGGTSFFFNELLFTGSFFRDFFILENTVGFCGLFNYKKNFRKNICVLVFNTNPNSFIFNSKKYLYAHNKFVDFSSINFIFLRSTPKSNIIRIHSISVCVKTWIVVCE